MREKEKTKKRYEEKEDESYGRVGRMGKSCVRNTRRNIEARGGMFMDMILPLSGRFGGQAAA